MTVGAEIDSTTSKVTNWAANNRNVHRAWLATGELDQARFFLAIQLRPLRWLRTLLALKGGLKHLLHKAFRTVNTVRGAQEKASAACSSLQFGPSASTFSSTLRA